MNLEKVYWMQLDSNMSKGIVKKHEFYNNFKVKLHSKTVHNDFNQEYNLL